MTEENEVFISKQAQLLSLQTHNVLCFNGMKHKKIRRQGLIGRE